MDLTLSVLAGILLILPGLASIAGWNLRATRSGATRPELPLTAVSVLLIAIGISMAAHLAGYLIIEIVRNALTALGMIIAPDSLMSPLRLLVTDGAGQYLSVWNNPFEAALHAATGKDVELATHDALCLVAAIGAETLLVTRVLADEGFDLATEGVDFNNHGWVFQHVVRPAQNGYRPIAHVLTTMQKDGLGIGYRGTVVDIRQSEKGQTLAISLLEPERFLYHLKGEEPAKRGAAVSPPTFERHAADYIGGVVTLDAQSISNIVVQAVLAEMVDAIEDLPAVPGEVEPETLDV